MRNKLSEIYFEYESSLECQDQGLPPLDLGDLIKLELIKTLGKSSKISFINIILQGRWVSADNYLCNLVIFVFNLVSYIIYQTSCVQKL